MNFQSQKRIEINKNFLKPKQRLTIKQLLMLWRHSARKYNDVEEYGNL